MQALSNEVAIGFDRQFKLVIIAPWIYKCNRPKNAKNENDERQRNRKLLHSHFSFGKKSVVALAAKSWLAKIDGLCRFYGMKIIMSRFELRKYSMFCFELFKMRKSGKWSRWKKEYLLKSCSCGHFFINWNPSFLILFLRLLIFFFNFFL